MSLVSLADAERRRWLTWANGLTALRLLAAPALAVALLSGSNLAAAGLFALAVATDFLDGPLARRRGEASPLGGLLDHGSDATFVSCGLGALACLGVVPSALPILVVAAFTQYALDSRALAGRPLRTSGLGRMNGIAYYTLLGVPVVRDAIGLDVPAPGVVSALGWVLVVTTLTSMLDRVRALLRR